MCRRHRETRLPNFWARFPDWQPDVVAACGLHAAKRRAIASGLVSARFIDAAIMQRSSGRVLSPLLRAMARWGEAPRVLGCGCDLTFARGMSGTFVKPPGTSPPPDRSSVRPTLSLIHPPPRHFTDLKGNNIDVMPRTGTGKTVTKRLRRDGLVPGVLFGPGDPTGELLQMPKQDVERLVRIYGLSGIVQDPHP